MRFSIYPNPEDSKDEITIPMDLYNCIWGGLLYAQVKNDQYEAALRSCLKHIKASDLPDVEKLIFVQCIEAVLD